MKQAYDLTGWDITHGAKTEWVPWGGEGAPARAKVLGTGDGYYLLLVEARAGYIGHTTSTRTPSSRTSSAERSNTKASRCKRATVTSPQPARPTPGSPWAPTPR